MSYERYTVTVTPTVKIYCGAWESGEYTVEVGAESRAKAISKARAEWRDNVGRGAEATFRARKTSQIEAWKRRMAAPEGVA